MPTSSLLRHILLLLAALAWPCIVAAQQPIQSFLYIEDDEVRHELLVSLGTLESLLPLQTADPATLSVAEQEAGEKPLLALVDLLNPVRLDDIVVEASAGRLVFFDRAVTEIVGTPEKSDLRSENAIAGVVLRYGTKGAPERVTLEWTAFNELIPVVPLIVFHDSKEERHVLEPARPSVEWKRRGAPGKPPLADVPTPAEYGFFNNVEPVGDSGAKAILPPLLRNVYRAFDHRKEEAIYDALSRSVTGDMLSRIYLDIRKGLEIEAEGGPTSRVHAVDIRETRLHASSKDGRAFTCDAEWTVTGSVEHWGHVHTRMNLYAARFDLAVVEEAWKITSMHVTRQERLEVKLSKRGEPQAPSQTTD